MVLKPEYTDGDVRITPPDTEAVRAAPKAPDVVDDVDFWLSRALAGSNVRYFSIYQSDRVVGQILLHDIDAESGNALVGYHIFESILRGRGIGTRALRLLQNYVIEQTDLVRLVMITSTDNVAARRIAEKCGFHRVGLPARTLREPFCSSGARTGRASFSLIEPTSAGEEPLTFLGSVERLRVSGADGTRTRALLAASQSLSQLSYGPRLSAQCSREVVVICPIDPESLVVPRKP
jgi:RimJ/RimL family protein N-acetyltransferase